MRVNGRVVSQALVIAIGVRETGERDILGVELGAAENRDFWLDFLTAFGAARIARGTVGD